MANLPYAVRRTVPDDLATTEFGMFLDGDTLVISLPSTPDFCHCANAVFHKIKRIGASNLQYVLIDCVALRLSPAESPGIQYFVDMGQFLAKCNVSLLLLDAAGDFYRYCEPRLPGAIWIHSTTGEGVECSGPLPNRVVNTVVANSASKKRLLY